MYLLKIERPDNTVYCTITYDRKAKGYRFINLTHNHICESIFKTVDEAMVDLIKRKETDVCSYRLINPNFNIDKAIEDVNSGYTIS